MPTKAVFQFVFKFPLIVILKNKVLFIIYIIIYITTSSTSSQTLKTPHWHFSSSKSRHEWKKIFKNCPSNSIFFFFNQLWTSSYLLLFSETVLLPLSCENVDVKIKLCAMCLWGSCGSVPTNFLLVDGTSLTVFAQSSLSASVSKFFFFTKPNVLKHMEYKCHQSSLCSDLCVSCLYRISTREIYLKSRALDFLWLA